VVEVERMVGIENPRGMTSRVVPPANSDPRSLALSMVIWLRRIAARRHIFGKKAVSPPSSLAASPNVFYLQLVALQGPARDAQRPSADAQCACDIKAKRVPPGER
jgi:hypothetical protein